MPKIIRVIPKDPKELLREAGYGSYQEFALQYNFNPGTVRKSLKRYRQKPYLPRKGSSARQIVVTFFRVTKPKVD